MHIRLHKITLWLILYIPISCLALEYNYSFNTEYEDSNNIIQRVDGAEGHAYSVGTSFMIGSTSVKEWDFNLNGNYQWKNYSLEELASEQIKALDGNALYKPQASNFRLFSLANLSQVPANRFQLQQANNIRDIKTVAFKPSYFFAITPVDRLNIDFTAIDLRSEIPAEVINLQDSSRFEEIFSLGYEKQINSATALAVIASQNEVDFELTLDQGAVDYEHRAISLRLNYNRRGNLFRAEAGRSEIEDILLRKLSVDQTEVSFNRQINPIQSVSLSYTNGVNNTLFNDLERGIPVLQEQQTDFATARLSEEYAFTYNYAGTYLAFSLRGADSKISQFFSEENKEQQKSYTFTGSYSLSRLFRTPWQSGINLMLSNRRGIFNNTDAGVLSNEIDNYQISYQHSFTQNFSLYLTYAIQDLQQVNTDNSETSFDTKNIIVGFVYSNQGR